jgi:hypothetical protein
MKTGDTMPNRPATPDETVDRVRRNTSAQQNRRLDRESQRCLERLAAADPHTIGEHIATLDREWDVERYLQANAASIALGGIVLGATLHPRFLVLPGMVFAFFLQHALQGWCPPIPVFRRMGVRTRREINREKYALKALRGDFASASGEPPLADSAARSSHTAGTTSNGSPSPIGPGGRVPEG